MSEKIIPNTPVSLSRYERNQTSKTLSWRSRHPLLFTIFLIKGKLEGYISLKKFSAI